MQFVKKVELCLVENNKKGEESVYKGKVEK